MESAIPSPLLKERTQARRGSETYAPPYPSYVARYPANVLQVVMAYFGVQHEASNAGPAEAALQDIATAFTKENGPGHWDRARFVDPAGKVNTISVAYWDDPQRFDRWFPDARAAWTGRESMDPGLGLYVEALRPQVESFETLFSSLGRPEGLAAYATVCAQALARAHARSGDRIAIASYLGNSSTFDTALVEFSETYADQNERDYEAFAGACKTGRLHAEEGI